MLIEKTAEADQAEEFASCENGSGKKIPKS